MGDIDLYDLVRECAHLALRAGRIISNIHNNRLESGNAILKGYLKDGDDKKSVATVADCAAQKMIIDNLNAKFPGLAIVGEEEEEDGDDAIDLEGLDNYSNIEKHPFLVSNCLTTIRESNIKINSKDIIVYIDPLDGTHEFVEKRVENVQTLIGIAVNGTPLAGVVGLPFWSQDIYENRLDIQRGGNGGAIIAGVVDVGTFGYVSKTSSSIDEVKIASSSSTKLPSLVAVQQILTSPPVNGVTHIVPGCGNKILSLLRGEFNMAVCNLKTSLWDTCAPQALLVASGGRLTDLTGCCINYHHPSITRAGETGNIYGVFASAAGVDHIDLVRRFRCCGEVNKLLAEAGLVEAEGMASDICRDTFGRPFTKKLLSELTGGEVVSYSCPEEETHRYLMSEAARIHLNYNAESLRSKGPDSVFFKRAVMRDLPHVAAKMRTAPTKLSRDVYSYQVEVAFLASRACQALIDALSKEENSVKVAKCLKAEVFPNKSSPIDSRFSMLLEDFSPSTGWFQTSMMTAEQLATGIQALARFHAFFWNGGKHNKLLSDTTADEVGRVIWPVATHWAPSQQPAEMMTQIADVWTRNGYSDPITGFGDGSDKQVKLGHRLQNLAVEIAKECHFESDFSSNGTPHLHRTIVHGDAKAANFFFKEYSKDNESGPCLDVGLIDFQWCGFGLGATELAYFIASCASPGTVDEGGQKEMELLRIYHSTLVSSIEKWKKDGCSISVPTFEELVDQYEAGVLDVSRIAFTYHWGRIKASPASFDAKRQSMLGPCAYNKHPDVARWLVSRCDALLTKRESKLGL